MKKTVALLLSLTLALLALSACDSGECTAHTDADANGVCDNCSAPVETAAESESTTDSEESTEAPATDAEYLFTVTLDNGTAAPSVSFILVGEAEHPLTSGADGKVTARLPEGSYTVLFDYDTLPEGCIPETEEVTLTRESTEISLTLVDNTPDGSVAKPFFISEDVTALTLAAGEEAHYVYRGAAMRQIVIPSADVTVTYAGQTYAGNGEGVTVDLIPVIGEVTTFSVKNVSGAKVETSMTLVAPLGSMENPIPMTGSTASVNVPAGGAIYYLLTAEKSGVLLVTSESATNNREAASPTSGFRRRRRSAISAALTPKPVNRSISIGAPHQ